LLHKKAQLKLNCRHKNWNSCVTGGAGMLSTIISESESESSSQKKVSQINPYRHIYSLRKIIGDGIYRQNWKFKRAHRSHNFQWFFEIYFFALSQQSCQRDLDMKFKKSCVHDSLQSLCFFNKEQNYRSRNFETFVVYITA